MLKFIYNLVLITHVFNMCQSLDDPWNYFQSSVNNENREELVVTNVAAEKVIFLKSNVTKWKSINIGSICYSVGLADTGLEILMSVLDDKTGFVIENNFIPSEYKPKDLVLFHNRKHGKSECIIVVSFYNQSKLQWLSIFDKNVNNNLWSWTLEDGVEHINFFKMETHNILFITTNNSQAFLYEFDIKNDRLKKWFIQDLSIQSLATSSAFNNFKGNYFLSLLQADSIIIYKYERNKFSYHSKIKAPEVSYITSFNIGFKTFVAINGYNACIYEFYTNGVKRQNIENGNLDGITYWLPVPVQTYRDEVLLVAQRNVDHGTHYSKEVDIFTYNGNRFEEHEDIPCSKFEENTSRLTCLTDDMGILGSSYVVIEDQIGLIIPRPNNSFLLFTIYITMKQIPNPKEKELYDLLEIKKKLEALIEEDNKKYEELTNSLLISNAAKKAANKFEAKVKDTVVGNIQENQNLSGYLDQVESIGVEILKLSDKVDKITNNEKGSNFNTVIINGKVKFEDDVTVEEVEVGSINGQNATVMLADIVRKDNITLILKNKTFSNLVTVENLNAKIVNSIDAKNIAFGDEPVVLNGNFTFENPVLLENVHLTSGNINNVHFEHEAFIVGKQHEGTLKFDNINVADNLRAARINDAYLREFPSVRSNSEETANSTEHSDVHIPKNLTVTFINGENFTQFLENICLVNVICVIPGTLRIAEKIQASKVVTEYLNDLRFPDEYILRSSSYHVNITGRKNFTNTLTVNKVTASGYVNGIDTEEIITTTTEQNLGNKTFQHFGVTDEIKIEGKIVGDLVESVLPNRSLEEVNEINANVVFNHLEVNGNIFVENNFNDQNYFQLLRNLLYHDDTNATITSVKKFVKGLAASRLNIESGSINKVKISSIMTKNTDQHLQFNLLKGNVKIQQLFVTGTYDNKNISEMYENLVKLTGEQFIDSTLTFDDLEVQTLEISGTLNDVGADEYVYTTGGGRIDKNVTFDKLIVENMTVKGNIHGNLSEFDLQDISNKYLSLTKNQSIGKHFNIDGSEVDNMIAANINGNENTVILNEQDFIKHVKEMLNDENLTVENLHIEDSVHFNEVNDKSVESILPLTIQDLLNRTNKKVTFENDIFVPAIEINQLSYMDWDHYVKHIVFKNETDIIVTGIKTFQNGVSVEKLIETKQLNDVPLEHILRKEQNQTIRGPVVIEGDVTFERVDIKETMNDVSVADVLKILFVSNGKYRLISDIVFRRLSYIKSLKVNGKINDKDIDDIFKDLAYRNKDIVFINDTVFKEPVFIAGNLAISNLLNHINFSDFTSQIVLTTRDANIDSLVTFSKTVLVQERMIVDENLSSHLIAGFNISDWVDKSIFLDKGLLRGHYTFEHVVINDNLITDFVNEIDMKKLVPLRRNQTIDHLEFNQLKFVNDIPVGKTVNGLQLPHEVKRTLMKDIDQEISPATIFKTTVLIRQNLNTTFLNNQDTSKIVTTNTDQTLTSKYNFNSKSVVESDLEIDGFINDVNFNEWKNKTLKINSTETQLISNDWKLENLTFSDDVKGFDRISGLNLTQISKEVEDKKDFKLQFEHGILDDYKGICDDVTFLHEKAKSQIYKFKYFEDFQQLSFSNKIKYVFYFVYNNTHYLLVNQENCLTDIATFNGTQFIPLFRSVLTGQFEQVVPVFDDDVLFLVTRGTKHSKCNIIGGINVWIFNDNELELKFNMEDQYLLQESLVPSTFYSIGKEGIIEYKIKKNSEGPIRYRKWDVLDENSAFVPRGLKTGLAVRTGDKLIFLDRTEPVVEAIETNTISEATIIGSTERVDNHYIPGKNGDDLVVLNVGIKSARNDLLAVASHEETVVRGSLDFIKIYDDPLTGKLFDKVPTYKPSSLLSIEFHQGETLLVFLENKRNLQIYEYKGIEGFNHRSSIKLEASNLFKMDLPVNHHLNSRKAIGVVNKNQIRILLAVMDGNQIRDNLNCRL